MRRGNFTCMNIVENCKPAGCTAYILITCEISDSNHEIRSFSLGMDGISDVLKAFTLMDAIENYNDWKDVDAMTALCKEAGVSPGAIVKKLGDELKALDIKKSR